MKRIFFLAIIVLFLVSSISAETFEQSTQVDFKKTCTDENTAICSTSAICNMTIKYPNSSFSMQSGVMENNDDGNFNITLTSGNLNTLGEHTWDMFCCDGGECGEAHGTFKVTSSGFEVDESNSTVFLVVIFFLIVLSTITFIAFLRLDTKPQTKWTFFIVSTMLFLTALNLISIVINDSLLNNRIAGFFDTFTAVSFLFYWFGFGLLAVIWFLTILNTILFNKKQKNIEMFGDW